MRTTINIDDQVFERLMEITEGETKTAAVNKALDDYIKIKLREQLRNLRGKIHIDENWRELREMELDES